MIFFFGGVVALSGLGIREYWLHGMNKVGFLIFHFMG
jgi:hypothetical protein